MRRCVFAPLAETDLEKIWRFSVDQSGEKHADAYISAIVAVAESIAEQPQRGASCNHIRAGYRKTPAGAHVIFYRTTEKRIEIIRILHRRMDWESRL